MGRRFVSLRAMVVVAVTAGAILIPAAPGVAAEVFSDGFESGDLSQWTTTTGFTAQQAFVKTGSWAGRATSTGGSADASKTLSSTQSDLYFRAFVNVLSHTGSIPILQVRTATGGQIIRINVSTSEKLVTNNSITSTNRQSTTTVTPGFHEVQLHTLIGTSGRVDVWFDGTLVPELSLTDNLGTTPVGRVQLGKPDSGASFDIVFDDVVASTTFIGGGGTPPPVPTGLAASPPPTSTQVSLLWNASSGATSYTVRRTGGAAFTPTSTSGTTFVDGTVAASTSYQYTVDACNTLCSVPSAPLPVTTPGGGTPPPVPTGLAASPPPTSTQVSLLWNASSGATSYTVRRTGGAAFTPTSTSGTTFVDGTVAASTSYQYTVDACNTVCSVPSAPLPVTTPGGGGGTTVVMAAGDIACDPADANFNGGNGTSTKCRQKFTGQLLTGADHVLPIGDTQYDCAGTTAYAQSYNLTGWGQRKNISHPILSDEDYDTVGTGCGAAGADGYFNYFSAQVMGKDYYTVDDAVSGWRFIALNSECANVAGGCTEGSAQNNFLENNIVPSQCTIAMLHKPRFRSRSTGVFVTANMLPFWQDLTAGDAEILLGGDSHFYERFNPMDVNGNFKAGGTVQFVVGTGGKSHGGLAAAGSRHPQSVTATSATFGVLKLTLHPGSYDWQFMVEGSNSFTDSGSATC